MKKFFSLTLTLAAMLSVMAVSAQAADYSFETDGTPEYYPACDCYVAAHRKTMLPMGTLADKALRKKRHDAHVALDSLWKNGIMSRKEAYRLLQLSMGLPAEDAHIAKFSAARCDEVIALSRRFRAAAARAA